MIVDFVRHYMKLLSRKYIAILVSILFSFCFFYAFFSVPPPGYCSEHKKYISDKDFVDTVVLALEKDMSSMVSVIGGERGQVSRKIRNSDARYVDWNFDPRKQNCCEVIRDQTKPILNRIFGRQKIEVRINSKNNQVGDYKIDGSFRFYFDVCGVSIESDVGLPNTGLPVISTSDAAAPSDLRSWAWAAVSDYPTREKI